MRRVKSQVVAWIISLVAAVAPAAAQGLTPKPAAPASQTALSAGPVDQRVRVTRPEGRAWGRVVAIDAEALTLLPDGKTDPVRIPMASISKAEISQGKRPRAVGILTGIGVGFVTGAGAGLLSGFAAVGDAPGICGGCGRGLVVGSSVGGASGILVGMKVSHAINGERWRAVPVASLANSAQASPSVGSAR